jgi:hypothetical protein
VNVTLDFPATSAAALAGLLKSDARQPLRRPPELFSGRESSAQGSILGILLVVQVATFAILRVGNLVEERRCKTQ